MNKSQLPKKYHFIFDEMKKVLTDEAFEVWFNNILNNETNSYPENKLRTKQQSSINTAIQQARQAVSSYAPSNGARKAVEALADALEQAQAQ